jgi:hypothetical protein
MTSFSVTLRGRRSTADLTETVARLAKLTGRSAAETERFLAMPAVAVKRGVDLRTANRYQIALDDCGACATIEREVIAEASLDGIPEGFRKLPARLRQAEHAHQHFDQVHATMVGLLADGVEGPGLRFAMEQYMRGMCGGPITLKALLRYFTADRLSAILHDARNTIAIHRRGGFNRTINYGYGNAGQISAEASAFYIRAAHHFEAFVAILRDHGIVTEDGQLPPSVVLRDGKGERLRAQGQRVQFCHRDSPYVHTGTVDGCHAIGVEVSRHISDGIQCVALVPYANLLLDGGDAYRPLPTEAVLERRALQGYALPHMPELRLMGTLEILLDLKGPLQTPAHQAFFRDFAARLRVQSGYRMDAAELAPGLFRVGGTMELAAEVVAQLMEPLRLKS